MLDIERLLLRVLLASAVVLGVFQPIPVEAAKAVVTDVRVGTTQDVTRVVLDVDKKL